MGVENTDIPLYVFIGFNFHIPKALRTAESREVISEISNSATTTTPATETKVACSSRPFFCRIWQMMATSSPTPAIRMINVIFNAYHSFQISNSAANSPVNTHRATVLRLFRRALSCAFSR